MSSALLDLLFSRSCEGCGAAMGVESGSLCWDCQAGSKVVQLPFCERCGDPVAGAVTGLFECAWCRKTKPSFDWARSAVCYEGVAKTCLKRFKYNTGTWLLDNMTDWLWALWQSCPPSAQQADVVTCVPLHPRRERERGYNQAELLGKSLAGQIGIPFQGHLLWRKWATATQTRLTAAQRAHNVKGVFTVPWPSRVRGARIVLVDDVMTTGATVNECARALKAAQADSVMVLTVARG